ncbi:MAG: DUF2752 domain-containing protein [Planctomycetes bacterium]|nr:DUF2752 domain-containing protein [Planctomycetota bacterium]
MDPEARATPAPPRRRTVEHWLLLGLALAALGALLALGFVVEPDPRGFGTHEQLGFAPCRFLLLTGVPCPGCGVTTSVAHAARGDLAASLASQPFGLVVLLLAPAAAVYALVKHARGHDLAEVLRATRLGWWAAGIGLAALAAWAWKVAAMSGR